MKTLRASLRSAALGVGLLGVLAADVFAASYLVTAGGGGPPWSNGMIYSVPSGANYEWDVSVGWNGWAHIALGGGGLNVNQYAGPGQHYYDVGTTAYADTVSYQLSGDGDGSALLYVGW